MGSVTSQMAILYQSLKQKTILAHTFIQHLQENQGVATVLNQFQTVINEY